MRRNLQSFLATLADRRGGGFARAGAVRLVGRSSGEVLARAGAAAKALRAEGIAAGDRVILLMEDGPDWIAGFAACLAVGAVAVPLDRSSSESFVEAVARRCGARALLCDEAPAAGGFRGAVVVFARLGEGGAALLDPIADPEPGDLAEIVFTSGTTAEPRGVMITHRNVLSALAGIEEGILKRRRLLAPFSPLTIVSLVPLSHLFGQALGLFIPAVLGARVVHSPSRPARALLEMARREKAWVMVVVPRHLAAIREHLSRSVRPPARADSRRWWVRALRSLPAVRLHGWRLRAFVVGGARLDPDLEGWFKGLGYLVVQGYGLTETAPVVSVSNPFDPRTGLLGRPGRAMEVRIEEDGELLIRGPNVTEGYYGDEEATRAALEGGWLRTGDLVSREPDGTLRFVGRKKDVIVTAEGQNVFPDEVESALRAVPGVADCAVFAARAGAGEQVTAAIIPAAPGDREGRSLEAAVAEANARLAPHQRIRGWTIWPHPDFPRTPTGKVLRRLVAAEAAGGGGDDRGRAGAAAGGGAVVRDGRRHAEAGGGGGGEGQRSGLAVAPGNQVERAGATGDRVEPALGAGISGAAGVGGAEGEEITGPLAAGGAGPSGRARVDGAAGASDPLALLRKLAGGEARPDQRLGADLGLSSIDVAELAAAIEERYQVEVGPAQIHEDATLDEIVRGARAGADAPAPWPMPRWARSAPARAVRSLLQASFVFPGLRLFTKLRVEGCAHVASLRAPVLIAANHESHLDVPLLLAALPRRARRRVAVAMQPEYFEPWLRGTAGRAARVRLGWQYRVVSLLLHTFPFPRSAAFKVALEYAGGLVDGGWTILVFPEGELSPDGAMHAFRPGVGLLSRELRLDVLPARIRGAWAVLPRGHAFPRGIRRPVVVTWGPPLARSPEEDPASFAARVEKAVRAL